MNKEAAECEDGLRHITELFNRLRQLTGKEDPLSLHNYMLVGFFNIQQYFNSQKIAKENFLENYLLKGNFSKI